MTKTKILHLAICGAMASLCGGAEAPAPTVTFMKHSYRLGSYNQKPNPMWEFAPPGETMDNWSSLVTIIDRPDARTLPEMDRLAEGIMSTYKSAGGRILLAKSMRNEAGVTFNYMLAAFEEPDKKRFELNFVKAALGSKNTYVMIYGVRITDPKDYRSKAKEFLDQHSGEVGQALGNGAPPDLTTLPRRVF